MTDIHADSKIAPLDVEQVLRSKNPRLVSLIPDFLIRYLKRIVHQDELNEFLRLYGTLDNRELIGSWLNYLSVEYNVYGKNNLPSSGRHIFVSNHPLGGLDGLVFIYELSKYYSKIKFPVNDILLNIGKLNDIFLPVNKHGKQAKEAALKIEEAYCSDAQILYFPAGLCSRKRGAEICDLEWHKSFITKAVAHRRDVVPAHFSGRNSDFFYKLSNIRNFIGIRSNIEMLYLADEMFRQKGKVINLVIGTVIPWQTFDKSKSPGEWASWVKARSYELGSIPY